jgi:NAD(P)-dependent dehydrogenase (short-subunit alcohol dehydrogenase family)
MTHPLAKSEKNTLPPIALITGSAVRIGAALARHLAQQGWNIAIHCNRSHEEAEALAEEIRNKGRQAIVMVGNLSNTTAVERIFPTVVEHLGIPSLLINNASLFEKDGLESYTEESLQQHFAVNLFAPLALTRDFRKHLPKGQKGNVIHLTDGMKGWSLSATYLTYSLSKLALEETVALLVRELAPDIRINAIAPGPTLPGKEDDDTTFAKLEKLVPAGVNSSPEEVCRAVDFILQTPSLTGQVIRLAGGVEFMGKLSA